MQRVILGLVKGLIVGGGVAYGLLRLGFTGSIWVYLGCALVGALVGVVCGRPPWKSETIWTPVVKMVVGAVIGVGLCALGLNVLPDLHVAKLQDLDVTSHGPLLAGAVGVLYGLFVEIDDGGAARAEKEKDKLPPALARPKLKGKS